MATAEPPAPPPAILYVDTSALLKLLVREAESAAIERELLTRRDSRPASSRKSSCRALCVVRAREERADAVIDGSLVLQGVLSSAAIIPLSESVVAAARKVKPVHVGALDAIHIASALSLGKQLAGVATYDKRMQDALKPLGVRVIAPEETARDAPTADPPISTARDSEATE
jgi:predicted nucleic acid-binding protein